MTEPTDFELELVRKRLAERSMEEGVDYVIKMDDGELLQALGTDARKWAAAFCQQFPSVSGEQEAIATWFANAIESARYQALISAAQEEQS